MAVLYLQTQIKHYYNLLNNSQVKNILNILLIYLIDRVPHNM